MKQEAYSCLKMLESLQIRLITIYKIGGWDSAEDLGMEYGRIINLLENHLNKQQFDFIPIVQKEYLGSSDFTKMKYLRKLITANHITISYLKSLEMDLDKELTLKKEELTKKEKELELREKEVESLNKLLTKSLEAIKQFPELQRSKVVEEIKKSHRQIEEHTKD